ncbi:MAG: alpha/beta hydrolase [Parabacteroides sp.]|nr:alpha/beta hydrolase [Parabacteroides sp.]
MKFLLTFFIIICSIYANAQYSPDLLGNGFQSKTIQMPKDYEGDVVCTLIRKKCNNNKSDKAILYIHGYNDYFFQSQLGDSCISHGYNFYALDLRKYGRSLLAHQDAFFCKDIKEYFADIDSALTAIKNEGNMKIIMMAHSTGGLISSYYLNNRADDTVDALVLNSPFLDWNFGWFMESIVLPTVAGIGYIFPNLKVQGESSSSYANSLLKVFRGEWMFNTDWKKPKGHPKKAGWIKAINKAQKSVQKHSDISCPVLVLSSDKSFPESNTWHDEYMKSDIVLDVKDIQEYGVKLGKNVTCVEIQNGMHDLILSGKSSRDSAYKTIFSWLKQL